jgi:hypothetical protein
MGAETVPSFLAFVSGRQREKIGIGLEKEGRLGLFIGFVHDKKLF